MEKVTMTAAALILFLLAAYVAQWIASRYGPLATA